MGDDYEALYALYHAAREEWANLPLLLQAMFLGGQRSFVDLAVEAGIYAAYEDGAIDEPYVRFLLQLYADSVAAFTLRYDAQFN